MTLQELGEKLRQMYRGAGAGEKVVMIHLFGITYADEIRASGESKQAIARAAGISEKYYAEISKGVKLSQWVVPR